jgi:anti-sigma regulatory factor (Ser/Thr protein kinase)
MSAMDLPGDRERNPRPPHTAPSSRRSFRPEPSASSAARQVFDDLSLELDDDLVERGRLALSEAVTNCIQHARLRSPQLIDMEVWVLSNLLRIEVTDGGLGFDLADVRPIPDRYEPGGWGLWLIGELTDRWGADLSPSTRIWMEFDRAA